MKIKIHDNNYRNIDSNFKRTRMIEGAEIESLKYQMAIVNVGRKYLDNKLENSRTNSEYLKIQAELRLYDRMYFKLYKAYANLDDNLRVDNYLTEHDRYLQKL